MTKKEHMFIPDPQCKPGVPLDHLEAAGNYALEHKPDVIVNIGDHWDMPSLSQYEQRGSKYFEGKTYRDDIEAGKEGMRRLLGPIWNYNKKHSRWKKRKYEPRIVLTLGNHENRIERALNQDPRLEGTIGLESFDLNGFGVEWYNFLEIVEIDGILYSHYFIHPDANTGNPLSGTIENRMRAIGQSFSQGHQQRLQYGIRYTATGKPVQGLVCGSFYQHNEGYMGPQANNQHFRGIVYKHEVKDGAYDPMMVSLNFLMENYL